MRSHPYANPPPLPPILDELAEEIAAILPNQGPRRPNSDTEIELCELDPDTSRLLPVRRKRHRVRVQGKLALVRSVSTVNLKAQRSPFGLSPRDSISPRFESAVGSTIASPRRSSRVRRRSLDDTDREVESGTETEEEERETTIRDRQLRGYGIGGAGNIRRPTEVVHFPSRRASSLLFSPTSPLSPTSPDKRRWNIREMLGLVGDRKGKGKGTP